MLAGYLFTTLPRSGNKNTCSIFYVTFQYSDRIPVLVQASTLGMDIISVILVTVAIIYF